MRGLFFALCYLQVGYLLAQVVTTNPVIFTADQLVTITFDATQGNAGLLGANSVFMHAGVITSSATGTSWSNVVGQWGNPSSLGQMTAVPNQPNKWQITITPRTYFNVPSGTAIYRLGMVFREAGPCGGFGGVNSDCRKGGTAPSGGDIFIEVSQGGFELALIQPSAFPVFKSNGETISILGVTNQAADLKISINGQVVKQETNATNIGYDHIANETGTVEVLIEANNGATTISRSFNYVVRDILIESRPATVKVGINYHTDPSQVTLCFLAPLKSSLYVIGDFNDWQVSPAYQMKKDGEHFWITLTNLTPGIEYGYQYLVDEVLYTADPFADKYLDPFNDQFISSITYPNLKPYPTKASGIVSVLQTNQSPYQWQTVNYSRPSKERLVIYELLVRDFDTPRSYQAVIDKLDYLQTLGINAIELMPIMEFSGNDSWGYNPIFYLAPDKAYGTKNKLKELVDKAHGRGMAVILDMVLNHADYEFPYVRMYWNVNKPAANNPWFNEEHPDPFKFFFDFNQESDYTKALIDTINLYWLKEYKFDGFRFDFTKGFTQKPSNDDGAFRLYDQSRVDILTRMANTIWAYDPQAYVILEHFAEDAEERVLANSGMMVWGNMTGGFRQNAKGFSSDSDLWRTYYKNRSGIPWNNPASVVAYMESHDEERMMVENFSFGNSNSTYSAKNLNTALERMKGTFAFLFGIQGPKMIWQFGELGYDISINQNGRTGMKPILWNYYENPARLRLFKVVSELLWLRNNISAFHTENFSFFVGTDLYKSIVLRGEPYTATPQQVAEANVVIIGNFDITTQARPVTFPHAGKWYHHFSPADSITITATSLSITLQPGEFRVYTDIKLRNVEEEIIQYTRPSKPLITSVAEQGKSVVINWQDRANLEIGYRVFRSEDNGAFIQIRQVAANATTHVDQLDLKILTPYKYFVQAYNSFGITNSDTLLITTSEGVVTSVNELVTYNIAVYPNPTKGVFTIDESLLNHNADFTLYTIQGAPAKMTIVDGVFDITENKAGIYLLKIISQYGSKIIKIVLTQ